MNQPLEAVLQHLVGGLDMFDLERGRRLCRVCGTEHVTFIEQQTGRTFASGSMELVYRLATHEPLSRL